MSHVNKWTVYANDYVFDLLDGVIVTSKDISMKPHNHTVDWRESEQVLEIYRKHLSAAHLQGNCYKVDTFLAATSRFKTLNHRFIKIKIGNVICGCIYLRHLNPCGKVSLSREFITK